MSSDVRQKDPAGKVQTTAVYGDDVIPTENIGTYSEIMKRKNEALAKQAEEKAKQPARDLYQELNANKTIMDTEDAKLTRSIRENEKTLKQGGYVEVGAKKVLLDHDYTNDPAPELSVEIKKAQTK